MVIIDTFSRITYLKHTLLEDARTAVEGLLEWHSNFVLADSYFANQVMQCEVDMNLAFLLLRLLMVAVKS